MSSRGAPAIAHFRLGLALGLGALALAALSGASPLAAQDAAVGPPPPPPARPRINVLVTVPSSEGSEAQARDCAAQGDASTISGEIVVCRQTGDDGSNSLSGSRKDAQRRYAEETMLEGAPRSPDFLLDCNDQGNPFGCVSFGKAPPPAYIVDFQALPSAPPGSDADRIARGLPPLGKAIELSPEEEKTRREAAGIRTVVPPRSTGKKGS